MTIAAWVSRVSKAEQLDPEVRSRQYLLNKELVNYTPLLVIIRFGPPKRHVMPWMNLTVPCTAYNFSAPNYVEPLGELVDGDLEVFVSFIRSVKSPRISSSQIAKNHFVAK